MRAYDLVAFLLRTLLPTRAANCGVSANGKRRGASIGRMDAEAQSRKRVDGSAHRYNNARARGPGASFTAIEYADARGVHVRWRRQIECITSLRA